MSSVIPNDSGSWLVVLSPSWASKSPFQNTDDQAPLQTHQIRILEKGKQAFVLFKMLNDKLEVTNDQPGLRAPAGYGSITIHLWHVILMINLTSYPMIPTLMT